MAKKVTGKQTFKNVKFVHCRQHHPDGSVNPHGGLTIAYVMNAAFKVVGFSAARCNIRDMYNKQVGRMKSAGRLLSEHWYEEVPEIDEKTFIEQALEGYQREFGKAA